MPDGQGLIEEISPNLGTRQNPRRHRLAAHLTVRGALSTQVFRIFMKLLDLRSRTP
jgi:hypothetical protein